MIRVSYSGEEPEKRQHCESCGSPLGYTLVEYRAPTDTALKEFARRITSLLDEDPVMALIQLRRTICPTEALRETSDWLGRIGRKVRGNYSRQAVHKWVRRMQDA